MCSYGSRLVSFNSHVKCLNFGHYGRKKRFLNPPSCGMSLWVDLLAFIQEFLKKLYMFCSLRTFLRKIFPSPFLFSKLRSQVPEEVTKPAILLRQWSIQEEENTRPDGSIQYYSTTCIFRKKNLDKSACFLTSKHQRMSLICGSLTRWSLATKKTCCQKSNIKTTLSTCNPRNLLRCC